MMAWPILAGVSLPGERKEQEKGEIASVSVQGLAPLPAGGAVTPEEATIALKREELALAEKLIKEFPGSEEPFVLMGNVLGRHGNPPQAIKFWAAALRLNPKRADVYKGMGWLAMKKGAYEEAIGHWRKALEIDPEIQGVHSAIARALMGLGRQKEAIRELERDIQISPRTSLSYFLLGQEYLQQKEYGKAKKNYEMAIAIEPTLTNAYYGLFTVCARLKEGAKSREYMAIFKKLKAEDMKTLKDRNDAYNDLVEMRKGVAETYVHAGQMHEARASVRKAEELLKRAATLNPKNTVCLMTLASLYQRSNRTGEALDVHKRISEIEPANPICYLNIGIFSARLKRFGEAEAAFGKVITLAPTSSSGYRELARLYLRSNKKLPEARVLAEKAVSFDGSAEDYYVLSWACGRNSDSAAALAAIKKAVELEPDNPQYKRIYEQIKKGN